MYVINKVCQITALFYCINEILVKSRASFIMKVLMIFLVPWFSIKIQISDKNHDSVCLMSKRTLKVTKNVKSFLLNGQNLEGCKPNKNIWH